MQLCTLWASSQNGQCISLYCRINALVHSTSTTVRRTKRLDIQFCSQFTQVKWISMWFSHTKAKAVILWKGMCTGNDHIVVSSSKVLFFIYMCMCAMSLKMSCKCLALCCCSLLSSVLSSIRLREIPVLEREDTALDKVLDLRVRHTNIFYQNLQNVHGCNMLCFVCLSYWVALYCALWPYFTLKTLKVYSQQAALWSCNDHCKENQTVRERNFD